MRRRCFLSIIAVCAAACAALRLALRSPRCPEADVAGVGRERGPVEFGSPVRDVEAVAEFVRDRITCELPATEGVEFDPLTILAVVGLVCQLLPICGWSSVILQQRAIQRHPAGRVALATKRRLMERFAVDHPEHDSETSAAAVNAAVNAFAHAEPAELKRLHDDLQRHRNAPTPVDLFELSESLSGLRE